MQRHKCCYCERRTVPDHNDVEHYRPFDLYWWLAWTWENLLFACAACNRKGGKLDQFPLAAASVRLTFSAQPPGAERPLLVDPTIDDPREHIRFARMPDGRWAPIGASERGRETIKILDLSRDTYLDDFTHHVTSIVMPVVRDIQDAYMVGSRVDFDDYWRGKCDQLLDPDRAFRALSEDVLRHEWLAAHEAAHTVQQRNGAVVAGGVGQAGDAHEQHADRGADQVVAGGSAEALLGAPGGSSALTTAVQRFKCEKLGGDNHTEVSNTGKSAVVPSQKLFAETSLVTTANAALKNVGKHGSHIKLVEDPSKHVTPKATNTKINRVLPIWVSHGKDDGNHASCSKVNDGGKDSEGVNSDKLAMPTDYGNSSGSITGSTLDGHDRQVVYKKNGKEQTSHGFDDPKQTYHDEPHNFSNKVYFDLMPGFIADPANEKFLIKDHHFTESGGKKTLVTITDALQAKLLYHRLKLVGQDAFDKAAGINHYANPNIGESYTMVTEANIPGFKQQGDKTWNFHWAGVVMKDGADNLTLENFAVTEETAKEAGVAQGKYIDRDWNFDMYGTVDAKGEVDEDQTFHKEHLDSGTHGTQATSMAVRTDK